MSLLCDGSLIWGLLFVRIVVNCFSSLGSMYIWEYVGACTCLYVCIYVYVYICYV